MSTDVAETTATPKRRPWYRKPTRWIILVIVLALVAGGTVFAIRWSNRGAKEVSTQNALDRYRKQGGGNGTAALLRPAPGVYEYTARGTENLSFLNTTQQWGPNVPATITFDDRGCWAITIDQSTNHTRRLDFCPKGRQLLETGGMVVQGFDFGFKVVEKSVFVCDPPGVALDLDAKPGATWNQSCDGRSESGNTNTTSAGTDTFVGEEDLTIGGTVVKALHYKLLRTITGSQKGDEETNRWYTPTDGLLLKYTADTRITSPAPPPIGDIIYVEKGEMTLTSLTPKQ